MAGFGRDRKARSQPASVDPRGQWRSWKCVFYDDEALLINDPDHSGSEDCFVLLGMSATPRVLLVVHSYRMTTVQSVSSLLERRMQQNELPMKRGESNEKGIRLLKARKNPYAKRLKKSITIRLDEPTIEYFRDLASE